MKNELPVISEDVIMTRIYYLREYKVMFDYDLAKLYNVETKVLKQAVKRNLNRFPDDFMFVLNTKELEDLRSQVVTSNARGTMT